MATESMRVRLSAAHGLQGAPLPAVADRESFEAALTALQIREKEHTHQGDVDDLKKAQ